MSDKFLWSRPARRVTVGKVYAELLDDGQISLGRVDGLIDTRIAKLDKSEIQDLLVALDGVQGDQPDPNPTELRDVVVAGAHAVARDIYRLTARPAIVDVGVHPETFYRLAGSFENGTHRMDRRDYDRGRVRVSSDVEISIARGLAK